MIEIVKKNKYILYAIAISAVLVIWKQRRIWNISTGFGYRVLEVLFTVCMIIAFTWIIYYLVLEKNEMINNREITNCYVKLLIAQTCAFLPMYTQNFMYGDDLWGFASNFNGLLDQGLYFSRPFISFLYGMLDDTSFLSIKYFRILNGLILFLFGCILFRFLTIKIKNCGIAFLFSVLAIAGCIAVDCIAYASVYPINMSLLLSAVSFVIYLKSREVKGGYKCILLIESGLCLFSAFCMYQIGTPIVFFMYMVAEREQRAKEKWHDISILKRAVSYLVYYGIVAILYLIVTNVLQTITGVARGQSARGEIITSFGLLISKMRWFIAEVCPQTLMRILAGLFGNSLFAENNMFYHCNFMKKEIGIMLVSTLIILIVLSIVTRAYRLRSFVYMFVAIVAIPLSFWPFLILPESVFLTYYAVGIILLFLWYVFDGLIIGTELLTAKLKYIKILLKKRGQLIIGIVTIVVVLQSNNYAENVWVNYNRDSYEYLANIIMSELKNNDNIDTIIVQGSLSPYVGGRDYVIFCVKDILNELGFDASSYKIISSDNEYYLLTFSDNEIPHMESVLGKEVLDNLLKYYMHDDMYGRYRFEGIISEQSELEFLKACFEQAGLLVAENNKTIAISMDGFNIRNSF